MRRAARRKEEKRNCKLAVAITSLKQTGEINKCQLYTLSEGIWQGHSKREENNIKDDRDQGKRKAWSKYRGIKRERLVGVGPAAYLLHFKSNYIIRNELRKIVKGYVWLHKVHKEEKKKFLIFSWKIWKKIKYK